MPDPAEIDDRIDRASARPFGRRFHLRGRERATAELRGPQTMRAHAAEIIAERLAPAEPRNDGRQTPYRNHPVFVAQHATATCCRSCLETWHGIAKGHRLALLHCSIAGHAVAGPGVREDHGRSEFVECGGQPEQRRGVDCKLVVATGRF